MLWSTRVRRYREANKMTQEALAEAFRVDTRTVRRWEAGHSRPPEHVCEKLALSPTPSFGSATQSALKLFVETAPMSAILLDIDFRVLANSPIQKARMISQYGVDTVGDDWLKWNPQSHRDLVERFGGPRGLIKKGFSSVSIKFHRPVNEHNGNKLPYTGHSVQTVLRLDGGDVVHLAVTTDLPHGSVLFEPKLTWLDEIHQEE